MRRRQQRGREGHEFRFDRHGRRRGRRVSKRDGWGWEFVVDEFDAAAGPVVASVDVGPEAGVPAHFVVEGGAAGEFAG